MPSLTNAFHDGAEQAFCQSDPMRARIGRAVRPIASCDPIARMMTEPTPGRPRPGSDRTEATT